MLKTFKYRLYPTETQERQMFQVLNVCRHWYNMCLEERKLVYELEGRQVSKSEQQAKGKLYRAAFPQAHIVFSQTLQTVADDLEKAFQAFFRRVKAGETPGYPRFKNRNRFNSFAFKQFGVGASLDGRRLKLFGIGRVALRWHREIPEDGTIKTCRIKHQAGQWFVSFAVELSDAPERPKTGRFVGLDVGISALVTTSEGEKVENPNYYRVGQRKLRVLSRALARKRKGGKNRHKALKRVQRQHQHIANQRGDYLHKLSTKLIDNCDGIALEDLATRNMVKNPHLSKAFWIVVGDCSSNISPTRLEAPVGRYAWSSPLTRPKIARHPTAAIVTAPFRFPNASGRVQHVTSLTTATLTPRSTF